MREVSYIIPTADNDGEDLSTLHDLIRADLAHHFGGYTESTARGGWLDGGTLYTDVSRRYTVAIDPADERKARAIAVAHAGAARQHSLYWQGASGEVEIIDLVNPRAFAQG